MKTIRFFPMYVGPILKGEKTHTVRPRSNRLPEEGERVVFKAGGEEFAEAIITKVTDFETSDTERMKELLRIYPGRRCEFRELEFRIVG